MQPSTPSKRPSPSPVKRKKRESLAPDIEFLLDSLVDGVVLDLGCGYGRLAKYALPRRSFETYIGLDGSLTMLGLFADRYRTDESEHGTPLMLIHSRIETIPLPDGSVDNVVIAGVLLHNSRRITHQINSRGEAGPAARRPAGRTERSAEWNVIGRGAEQALFGGIVRSRPWPTKWAGPPLLLRRSTTSFRVFSRRSDREKRTLHRSEEHPAPARVWQSGVSTRLFMIEPSRSPCGGSPHPCSVVSTET